VVLGDQLAQPHPALEALHPSRDALWMAEVPGESLHVPSHTARTVLFLSAMRHFARRQREDGWTLHYHALGEHRHHTLESVLEADLRRLRPCEVQVLQPGEIRVQRGLEAACRSAGVTLTVLSDPLFLVSLEAFSEWAGARKQPRMEHFYRDQRRRLDVLMEDGEPAGGQWNFDAENRRHFGREGPGRLPTPKAFPPDALTRKVIQTIAEQLPDLPGRCEDFDWPVTPAQAREALDDFIAHRLPYFGQYQDAMWGGEPWLYHARLSAALNLHLLGPREVIAAAEGAWHSGHTPLAAAEGFVRQILGWREYVRGLYFHFGERWHEGTRSKPGSPCRRCTGMPTPRCTACTKPSGRPCVLAMPTTSSA